MEKLEIDNKQYLFALEWVLLNAPGREAVKEAKNKGKDLNKSDDVDYKYAYIIESNYISAGFVESYQKVLPAAAYLAQANSNYNSSSESSRTVGTDWVLIEPLGDKKYWVIAIGNGAPIPDSDVIVDNEEELDELVHTYTDPGTFEFYTPDEEVFKQLQDLDAVVEEKGFSELIEGIKLKNKYTKIKGINFSAILVLFLVLFLAVVGYFGYSYYQKIQKEKQQEIARKQAIERQKQKEQTKKEAVQQYKEIVREGYKNLNDKALSNNIKGSNKQILSYWVNIIGNVPVSHNGWELQKVRCDLSHCVVDLNRTDLTNNRILKQKIDGVEINGESATYDIKFPESEQLFLLPESIASDEDLLYNYISDFQNLSIGEDGVDYDISQPKKITYKIPPLDVSNSELPDLNAYQTQSINNNSGENAPQPVIIDNGWYKGDVTFKGTFIEFLYDMYRYIPNSAFSVNNIEFSYPDMNWTLEADYIIKEKNPNMTPVSLYQQQLRASDVDPATIQGGMPDIDSNITSLGSNERIKNIDLSNQ